MILEREKVEVRNVRDSRTVDISASVEEWPTIKSVLSRYTYEVVHAGEFTFRRFATEAETNKFMSELGRALS